MVLKLRCSIEFNCLKKIKFHLKLPLKENDHIHIKLRERTRTRPPPHAVHIYRFFFFFSHFLPSKAIKALRRKRLQSVKEYESKKKILRIKNNKRTRIKKNRVSQAREETVSIEQLHLAAISTVKMMTPCCQCSTSLKFVKSKYQSGKNIYRKCTEQLRYVGGRVTKAEMTGQDR